MITLSLCSLPPCLLFLFHFLPPPPLLPASIPLLPGLEYKAPGTSHCSPHRCAKPQGEHTSTACTLCVALPPQKKQRGAGISIYECSPLSLLLTCTCSHNLFVFFPLNFSARPTQTAADEGYVPFLTSRSFKYFFILPLKHPGE